LFSGVNDFADELLSGRRTGKSSPVEVAQWIDDCAAAAAKDMARAATHVNDKENPEYRRLAADVAIQAGLGQFFAAKFRAAVLYRIFEKTEARAALEAALDQYRRARAAWAAFAEPAKDIYRSNITVGELPQLHGHWLDRLQGIDQDIALVAARLIGSKQSSADRVINVIRKVLDPPQRQSLKCRHTPPASFSPGQALAIELTFEEPITAVKFYYRHVNQAQRFTFTTMTVDVQRYRAEIPAAYTDPFYPLEYYFEVTKPDGVVQLYPGFSKDWTNQPYFVVRKS
jgi:hypothetical protein